MTRSRATQLPSEILQCIFTQMPQQTLIICQHVCKLWHYTAKELCYKTITYLGERDKKLSKLLYCLESSLAGELVQVLQIDDGKTATLTAEEIVRLVGACPNLNRLTICNNQAYFSNILSAKIELNKLRELLIPYKLTWRDTKIISTYYAFVHKYSKSIEKLTIPLACSPTLCTTYGGIYNYLKDFQRLKELSIKDGSQKTMVYLHQLLSTCTELESLDIQLGHPLLDPDTTTVDSNNIQPYSDLRSLNMFLPNFSVQYMRYIINRFTNIKHLELTMNQNAFDWINNQDNINKFMQQEYIPFVQKVSTSSITIKINDSSPISDFVPSFMSTIRSGNLRIDSQFRIESGRAERTDVVFKTAYQDSSFSTLSQCTTVRDYTYTAQFPYVSHLKSYGTILRTLDISLSNSVKRAIDIAMILHYCPNIKELKLHIDHSTPRESSWATLMELYGGKPNIYVDTETYPLHPHQVLSALKLYGGMITHSTLHLISQYTKNLRYLSLINCSYDMVESDDGLLFNFDAATWDLTQFTLDTLYFYHKRFDFVCFDVACKDGVVNDCIVIQQAQAQENDKELVYYANKKEFDSSSVANNKQVLRVKSRFESVVVMDLLVGGKVAHQQHVERICLS